MIKNDIITEVAQDTGQSEYITRMIVDATMKVMTRALQKRRGIVVRGFGTFKIVDRAARKARNLKTGEPVYIPQHKEVVFEPGKDLKDI